MTVCYPGKNLISIVKKWGPEFQLHHFNAQWCVINPDLNLTFFGYKVTWIVRSTSSALEIKWNLIYKEHFVISESNKSACVCYFHCSSVNHLSFLNCETHGLQFSPDLVKVTRGCIMQIPNNVIFHTFDPKPLPFSNPNTLPNLGLGIAWALW